MENSFNVWITNELKRVNFELDNNARKCAELIARRNTLQDARDKFEEHIKELSK